MNYKKLLPNKKTRLKLLKATNFVPDEKMVRFQYRIKTGRKLNLKNPERYTEKLQWYKLYYRNPLMTLCSDKYLVRKYVKEKNLENILNPLYGVYEDVSKINFDSLPNSFAIKNTSGAGGNIFVENKDLADLEELKKQADEWLKTKSVRYGREWSYYNIRPRIVIEKLIDRDETNDIPDYKFFCFNGRVKYLYTMVNYTDNHDNGRCSFFTPDFKKLPYRRSEFMPIEDEISKPENFDKMIEIAEILSKDFPHVRVDLYNIRGEIIFGELTFYNASGYTVFKPDEFDFILGEEFRLPQKQGI